MNQQNVVLLLTGTIKPNTSLTLFLKDPIVRKNQYINAIEYYLKNTEFNIVFTENSGFSLLNHFKHHQHRLEILTFSVNKKERDRGKGFRELEIIDYAFNHSEFINNSKSVVKITGRLKVLNIKQLVKVFIQQQKKHDNLIACNLYKNKKMDSRCFIFTKNFWPVLKEFGKDIDPNYAFEKALFDAVKSFNSLKDNFYNKLRRPLRIKGVSGGFGTEYKSDFVTFFLKSVRHFFKNNSLNGK